MSTPKADYSAIASSYDAGRRLPEESIRQWVGLIIERGRLTPGSTCLDLGCGTGRFSVPLALESGSYVVGADVCFEMLSEALAKPASDHVDWMRTDAQRLGLRSKAFQCVFMSLVLHHVDDAECVLRESRRVLLPGGVLLIRTTGRDDMDTMPVYRFFPGAREIDESRLPTIGALESSLLRAGFAKVRFEKVKQSLVPSVADYLDKTRRKSISALTLLSEADYADGVRRMEQHFASMEESAALAEVAAEQMTLVIGEREPWLAGDLQACEVFE